MRNATTLAAIAFALLLAPPIGAEDPDSALKGRYWLPEKDGQFEMYEKAGRFFGRVVAYDVPDQLDERNPDPKLRSRPFVGIDMFESFRFDPESGRWVDGTVYDGKGGSTYDGYLWFEDGDPNTLLGRGYIGISVFGRTERFERVAE